MLKHVVLAIICVLPLAFTAPPPSARGEFPYRDAGLTEQQAAAHLLNRFTFGPRPGDVDAVVKIGLEKWFGQQLDGKRDAAIDHKLADFDTQHLTNPEIGRLYVRNGQVARMAIKDGYLKKEEVNKEDKKEYKESLKKYMDSKGLKPEQELVRQTINQKILRAVYSENQLHEVLTDFWFNHFNVSFTKNNCSLYIPIYERETIRPNVTGDFRKLLIATAQSPAMLMYLDNASSVSVKKGKKGLNENYAREVMELHTLGVDGGYTQNDVTQAARVLTGWTVKDNDFFFAANRHDQEEKIVLGKKFSNGGMDEGKEFLELLANHPSTAKFITRKIAVRFVSDNPPQSLLDKMENTFKKENGNIRSVLLTMVQSPEFWQSSSLREKTKSPFELAISAVRAMNIDVNAPQPLSSWITRMGQKIYYYQAPTGFPDKANYWINTGSLLNRMNFGLALSTGKVKGTKLDLLELNNNHEPESAVEALEAYSKILLPERDVEKTIQRLTPLLNDPDLPEKIDKAANADSTRTMRTKGEYGLSQVVGIIIGSPEFQRR